MQPTHRFAPGLLFVLALSFSCAGKTPAAGAPTAAPEATEEKSAADPGPPEALPPVDAGAPEPRVELSSGPALDASAPYDAGAARVEAANPVLAKPDAGTPRVQTAKPDATKKPEGEPAPTATAALDKKTERLWKARCSACHGMDGKASTDKGRKLKIGDMTKAGYQAARSDERLKKSIREGVEGEAGEMEGFSELSADQLDGLVQYVRWVATQK